MSILLTEDELEVYLKKATELITEHPVVISKFITSYIYIKSFFYSKTHYVFI